MDGMKDDATSFDLNLYFCIKME